MPKLTLAERCYEVRRAAGYGGDRQMTAFARVLGISPAALFDLENGDTRELGDSLKGYIRAGANPEYLLDGKGLPMTRNAKDEKHRQVQGILGKMLNLQPHQIGARYPLIDSLQPISDGDTRREDETKEPAEVVAHRESTDLLDSMGAIERGMRNHSHNLSEGTDEPSPSAPADADSNRAGKKEGKRDVASTPEVVRQRTSKATKRGKGTKTT